MAREQQWMISILLGFISSFGTGLSKLAIRKSWLLERQVTNETTTTSTTTTSRASTTIHAQNNNNNNNHKSPSSKHKGKDSNVGYYYYWNEHDDTCSNKKQQLHHQHPLQGRAKRLRWWALVNMTLINPVLDIVAMAFCSPSIFAPFTGVALAWVVLLSPSMIHERPEPMRVLGASLIVLGEVLVACFGDHTTDDDVTLEQLRDSYRDPKTVQFLAVSVLWMMLLAYWMKYATSPFLQRFAWGVSGGYLTGFQNFIKDALTVLKVTGNYTKPWQWPGWFWVLCGLAAASAGGGLALLTACMKRYDATYTAGSFAGALVLSASSISAVHYHTLDHLEPGWSATMYPAGLTILMMGVGILMRYTEEHNDDERDYDAVPVGNRSRTHSKVLDRAEAGQDHPPEVVEQLIPNFDGNNKVHLRSTAAGVTGLRQRVDSM